LPMEEVARFLRQYALGDDTAWAAAFQDWFRESVLPQAREHRNDE